MAKIEPFIRWAGGKSWFVPHFADLLGRTQINHFIEPFLGSAAIFFSLGNKNKAYLSDINFDLINAYQQVKQDPDNVIKYLHEFVNTKEEYYKIRKITYEDLSQRAAQFIFLNQTSYNGIYRVNGEGQYNVPYGYRKSWHYNDERIKQASLKLKNAELTCGDFEINLNKIKKQDLVFLDPPYTVSHNNNGFIEYNKELFSIEDQERLYLFIEKVKRKEAYYILTNAHHKAIEDIFEKGDRKLIYPRKSLIGGKNSKREEITELVFTNLPEL